MYRQGMHNLNDREKGIPLMFAVIVMLILYATAEAIKAYTPEISRLFNSYF